MLKLVSRAMLTMAILMLAGRAAAAPPPLEVYGQLPNIEAMAISPDGANVAMIWTDGEQRKVVIMPAGGAKPSHVLNAGTVKVRDLQWAGPDHLLITTSTTSGLRGAIAARREYFMVADYGLSTRRMRPLLDRFQAGSNVNALNIVLDTPQVRTTTEGEVVFLEGVAFVDGRGVVSLFRVQLDVSAEPKLVQLGADTTRDWLVGADGEALAETRYDPKSGRWTLRVHGTRWVDSKTLDQGDGHPSVIGLGRRGDSVLLREWQGGRTVLREVSAAGVWSDPITDDGDGSLVFDPAKHTLIGRYQLIGDEDRYSFFDPADQAAWASIRKAFPKDRVQIVSTSDDHRKVIARVDGADGPIFVFVDLTTHKADLVGAAYEKLLPEQISPVQPIRFRASDGLDLTGYLTIPNGAQAKGLPLVVFPHGGPAVRDEPGFDWWAQAMASRGYAVLQVNYRGSDGFGARFLEAGYGQWGRRMQKDLSDGVRDLATRGVIDPKRVCIVGASYGGYAALAGAAFEPDVYRCAVSVAGPSDMRRFVAWSKGQNGLEAQRYWTHFMGADDPKSAILGEISPALHVEKVTAPVLLIHGRDDTVVPLEQSRIMADALKRAGKSVEFTTLDSTDHWLSRGDTRLATLRATIAFLEKNNPPH